MDLRPIIRSQGLVIREQDISENDRMVTLLTEDMGVVRAFANGAKRITDSKVSSTSLLFYSRLELKAGRNSYIVSDAIPIESFFDLRRDLRKLSLAMYFCDVAGELFTEGETGSEPLRLTLNVLKFLADGRFSQQKLKAIYELRILCLAGFMPDLAACDGCGGSRQLADGAFFSPQDGVVLCKDCQRRAGALSMWISGRTLRAMQLICYGKLARIFDVDMPEREMDELNEATERYMVCTLQRRPKTLDFYKDPFRIV